MAGDVDYKKMQFERRQHPRFLVEKDFWAMLLPGENTVIGNVIDISRGGLAFTYYGVEELSKMNFELTIINSGSYYCFDKIPVKVVSDFEAEELFGFNYSQKRRCGLVFKKLNDKQNIMLENFILNYTTFEKADKKETDT